MQVAWQTIDNLAKTKAIEIFHTSRSAWPFSGCSSANPTILPMTDAASTSISARRNGNVSCKTPAKIVRQRQSNRRAREDRESGAALLKWYRDRLRTIFSHVSNGALICNTSGGHLYYLLFASHNKTGVKIANEILSAGKGI